MSIMKNLAITEKEGMSPPFLSHIYSHIESLLRHDNPVAML